jgi:agmatine deiminase
MPAEWHPHQATWLAWPFGLETWFGSAHLERVRAELAEVAKTIAQSEEVCVLTHDDESWRSARQHLGDQARYYPHPLNDVWLRDIGPIFVTGGTSTATPAASSTLGSRDSLSAVAWKFNGWGGKFAHELDAKVASSVTAWTGTRAVSVDLVFEGGSIDVNGRGTALTTRQCLLNPNRNPHASEHDLSVALRDHLGIHKLIWLEDGLEGDHTDGHIDTIARFVDEQTVVCSSAHDARDPNFAAMERNLAILRAATDAQGQALRVIELPLPRTRFEGEDGRLPATYANFYITNQHVVVPIYGDPNDDAALEVLAAAFTTRRVVGLSAQAILHGGGAFHCLTQQQPRRSTTA